jgi:hypothetical protein
MRDHMPDTGGLWIRDPETGDLTRIGEGTRETPVPPADGPEEHIPTPEADPPPVPAPAAPPAKRK